MKQNKKKVFVIGVTGGIGSGKSTVTSILGRLGAKIIDADKIGKEILLIDSVCMELKDEFGKEIFDNGNCVNKKKLAKIVFDDKEKLKRLNEITHKTIIEVIYKMYENYINTKSDKIIVIDAPIPIKYGFLDLVDEVWVTVSDLELRIERVRARDNSNRDDIIKRINYQLNDSEYINLADRVFYNDRGFKDLEKVVIDNYFSINFNK